MTKYEWERQLKKGISGLPKTEQQRVLDYYNELFADKIDAGLREQYIISEFGNPYDVANKILVDYYNGDKENPEVDAYIYADSDDIDDAFDDEPAVTPTEVPKRKTWAERKEERREEHKARHNEHVTEQHDEDDLDDASNDKKSTKGARSASGLIVLICVLVYCVLGACFNLWHKAWLIFLAIPCVITLIQAINKRNWKIFAYPVLATLIFLLLGFEIGAWHPGWIIFVTIPLYYVLGDFITKNADGKDKKQTSKNEAPRRNEEPANKPEQNPERETNSKKRKSGSSSNVITIIAKTLLAICLVGVGIAVWWFVIGLFCGGLGMLVGGIGCIAYACMGSVNWLLVGAGLAVLGLGLVCTFGMAALFKPCFNMCKSFINTIKNSFDDKEAVK